MPDVRFIADLGEINISRSKREAIGNFLILKKEAIPGILPLAETNPHLSAKAIRAVEVVARAEPTLLIPYMDLLLKLTEQATTDAQIRPLAKIFESVVEHFFQNEKTHLSFLQLEKITQYSFDWLISKNHKTAIKAYSMNTLFMLSRKILWIAPELKPILEKNLNHETADIEQGQETS